MLEHVLVDEGYERPIEELPSVYTRLATRIPVHFQQKPLSIGGPVSHGIAEFCK
jgi:hypothetical protein